MQVIKIDAVDLSQLCNNNLQRYPFLLESVTFNDSNKYSILFAFPGRVIKSYDKNDNFLNKLSIKKYTKNPLNLPFVGGYFVYLSYELASQLESSLKNIPNNNLNAQATYIPTAIITNHTQNKTYIIDEDDNDLRVEAILADIKAINYKKKPNFITVKSIIADDENIFLENVKIAKKYIRAGDIFQANLSRKWQIKLSKDVKDIDVYYLLKQHNPAPFAVFAKFDDFAIISSSPERLFCVNDDIIQTRPIAGTSPRGKYDKILKNKLRDNFKEQAEHLMLLDLERNDLGRVCQYGSIKVDEMMIIESYEFVHHIVSNVSGKLKKKITFADIIKALFPGGTITGCPKIRSMQIIAELEQESREAYTGSIGYISNCGKSDFNILIRTIIKKDNNICFRAGSGIVFDSIALKELEETNHKAAGMLAGFKY